MTSAKANPAAGDDGAQHIERLLEQSDDSQDRHHAQAELPVTIARWQKNSREQILVQLTEYEGRTLVAARVWFLDDAAVLKPSKSGLTVAIRHLPALAAALTAALVEARARGLVGDEGGAA